MGTLLVLALFPTGSTVLSLGQSAPVATATTAPCAVGSGPEWPGYDPVNHYLYVPNYISGNITVFKGTCTLVGTITLPDSANAGPIQAAFDPIDDLMYVTDHLLDQVYEISGLKIVRTVGGDFYGPYGIVYSPEDYGMLVANFGSNNVSYIQGAYTVPWITVGRAPFLISFDPSAGAMLVSNFGSDNVSLWYPFQDVVCTIPVGSEPSGIAFDPADDYDYVVNQGSNTVTVVVAFASGNCNANYIEGTISGFSHPVGAVFSQSTLSVYVDNYNTGKVFVVGGSSGLSIVKKYSTAADAEPYGLAYDEANDDMYVGASTGYVYVLP